MSENEVEEHHHLTASAGVKHGVVQLLEVVTETAKELPEGKRYDVEIEITETNPEPEGNA